MKDREEDRRITLRTLPRRMLRGLDVRGNDSELFPTAGFLMNSIRHFDKSAGYEAKLQVVSRSNARPLLLLLRRCTSNASDTDVWRVCFL